MQKLLILSLLLLLSFTMTAATVQAEEELTAQERAILETRLVKTADLDDTTLAVRRNVPYTEDGDAGPRLDVYYPAEPGGAPRPVILYVHGGPLPPGSLPERVIHPRNWRFYHDHGELAVASGFVAVVPDHRYTSTADIERSFADVKAALDWIREHAGELGADPDKLGMWYFSGAGSHLGWLATDAPPSIRAAVAFYPVAGFTPFLSMGLGETPPEIIERWDPATHIHADMPPLMIARAGRDSAEINASIDSFVTAAATAGVTLDLFFHPTGQHGFDVRDDVPRSHELIEQALAFFVRHLQ